MDSFIGVENRDKPNVGETPGVFQMARGWGSVALPWALALALVVTIGLAPQRSGRRPPGPDAPWASHLQRMEEALALQDRPAATRAWDEAYVAALQMGGWEGMAAVGQAYLRLGGFSGHPGETAIVARGIFQITFTRAYRAESPEGVLRAAKAFADLGDLAMADLYLGVAKLLAGDHPNPEVRDRIRALQDLLASRSLAAAYP